MSSDLVMDTCLLAGEIMLKNGGETYRTEETMSLIARAAGMDSVNSSATPTSIILSFRTNGQDHTRMVRTPSRTINLNKVTLANDVSRRFVSGKITLLEAYHLFEQIDRGKPVYPRWLLHMAAGIASGSFSMLAGGSWYDLLPSVLAGLTVNLSLQFFEKFLRMKFFTEFMSALLGGLFAFLSVTIFPQLHFSILIIGAMLPLFPGIAITNSLRDLIAGDLVAGVSRGAEALLTALSVAVATAITLWFMR
ncbi:threonine/serine exporter family protein [Brevibacillus ruminantium]|uniref:Threonine/serine exporter family protein n=1 Tax=Brevibacillus ruminantium TaxID=2950604 RepID=A0ABY4WKN9_9BACL|nr:threonine/serine exporter family protein [Brevibacillus ruminantium]USG65929.1 threonine/serine exporter family protein [Brevibacillus ruminantium]